MNPQRAETRGPRMDTTTKVCERCNGTGIVSSPVVYAGVPGGCHGCRARGFKYTDKMTNAFGPTTEFVGVTTDTGVFGTVLRSIAPADQADDMIGSVTPITYEQARAFFFRYGTRATIATRS